MKQEISDPAMRLRFEWASPSEWLSEIGDRLRASWGMRPMPAGLKSSWFKFWAENCDRTPDELGPELQRLAETAPDLPIPKKRRRRK